MAVSVEVIGMPELQRKLDRYERKVFPAAGSRALNRTATTVRKDAVKTLSKRMGLKSRTVRDSIDIKRATQSKLESRVIAAGEALNLREFSARQTKKGVSARPWGQRRIFPGTFMVTKAGNRVFKRAIRGGQRVARLPIEPMFGPAVPDEFADEEIAAARRRLVEELLPQRLKRELDFRVQRLLERQSRGRRR